LTPDRHTEAGAALRDCGHEHPPGQARYIVLTGGPGAGKTAVLGLVRQHFCRHLLILDEAASILFGGGFPRSDQPEVAGAAQRAIYHVQVELEAAARAADACTVLCDRGTLDGLAYWPGEPARFFEELGTTAEREIARYVAVLHLATPDAEHYDTRNPLRVETAERARRIDRRIGAIWADHPHLTRIASHDDFLVKAQRALDVIEATLPACCRHPVPQAQERG
jgi:predicted ATPase